MKLSFILPIFNTGKYLAKCIDSALAQDLEENEYEIVLVYDEGSTDNSLEVAQAYASRYGNIRLISHGNRSIGESLNYAFPMAKGEYVEVIDTDDYLEPGKIGKLLTRMEDDHLDILRFDYQNVDEKYNIIFPNRNPKAFVDYSETITNGLDFLINRFGTACYVPTMIFRRDLLLRPGNEMLPIPINDSEWLPRIIPQADKVSSSKEIVYNYLVREGSKMHCCNQKKLLDSLMEVLFYYSKNQTAETVMWYRTAQTSTILSILSTLSNKEFKKFRGKYLSDIKRLNGFKLYGQKKTFRQKVKIFIINISPKLYVYLLECIHS